jgi:hypothetical protein
MTYKSIAVFGIYRDRGHVEQAVDALRAAGFRNSDVSVLLPDQVGVRNMTASAGGAGGTVGGALGWLAGIGALAVPGVGPFIASGPILGALTGVADESGVTAALAGMGIPKHEAARYEGRVTEGGVLLSVRCEDPGSMRIGMEILRDTSAKDVSFTGEAGAGSANVGKMTGD